MHYTRLANLILSFTSARVASVSMGLGEETLAQEQRDGGLFTSYSSV